MRLALAAWLAVGCAMAPPSAPPGESPPPPGAPGARPPAPEPATLPDVGLSLGGEPVLELLAAPGQPWVAVRAGAGTRWWNRGTGAIGPELAVPTDAVLAAHPDGGLIGWADGALLTWAAEATDPERGRPADPVHWLAVAPSGRWTALHGDALCVVDDEGAEIWRHDDALVAAWIGDRLVVAADGKVLELHPGRAATTELGPLPHDGEGGTWHLAPDGSWVFATDQRLTVHPPAQIGADDVIPPSSLALPDGTTGIGFVDGQRMLAYSDRGAFLFDRFRPVPIGGELEGAGEDLRGPLHP